MVPLLKVVGLDPGMLKFFFLADDCDCIGTGR